MKLKLFAAIAATVVATLGLSACGGSSDAPQPIVVASPTALTKTEITIGTGAEAQATSTVAVHYTGWLYSATAANNKGAQFDSSVGKSPLQFTLGRQGVIPGFEQGTLGMKVGGKRTVFIPASLGYGANGSNSIPANSGLVFDIELVAVL